MTQADYTAMQVLVDRSGSMQAIKTDAEGALQTFLEEQAALPGRATVRLSHFDTEYECIYPSMPVGDVPGYILQPRGMTALNDAIGRAIAEFGDELAGLPEHKRPGAVLFVIITDGEENSSREFTTARVKVLVEHQTNQWNWKFVFLAANQDAVLTGASYGIQKGSTMTFDANTVGTRSMGASLSTYAAATRSGMDYEFSDEERAAAQGGES